MNEPHNPQTPTESESDVVEQIRSIDVRAPDSLHAKIDAMIAERAGSRRAPRASGVSSSPPHARKRFGPRLAAVGSIVAAIVALVIVVALGSSSSTLSVHDAAALTLRAASGPAPAESSAGEASSQHRSTASPSPTGAHTSTGARPDSAATRSTAARSRPSSTRTRAAVASAIRSSPAQSRRP